MPYTDTDEDAVFDREYFDADEAGTTVTYRAANGHRMEYFESISRPGSPARGHSWRAWCAKGCEACAEGEPLPDW